MNNRTGKESIIDKDIFKNTSEFSEYFIGLLCTDGYIGKSDYTIQISLKDEAILQKISEITNVPIYCRIDKRFHTKIYSYRFRNKDLHEYFMSIGITTCKTNSLHLKIPITHHILRGIFDGDGSIFKNRKHNNIISIVSASKIFIEQISDFIESFNIKISSVKFHNNVYNLNIYSQVEICKFYNLIYKDATLFIKRKYLKFNAV